MGQCRTVIWLPGGYPGGTTTVRFRPLEGNVICCPATTPAGIATATVVGARSVPGGTDTDLETMLSQEDNVVGTMLSQR